MYVVTYLNNNKMKKQLTVLLTATTLLLTSCGGGGEKQVAPESAKESSGASLLADDVLKYDKNAIDPKAEVSEITIKATGASMAEMKYDQTTLTVPAGTTVKLTFISEATDPSMPHNWVLVRKGSLDRIAQKGMDAGVDKNYIPTDDDLLVSGNLLKPGEKEEIIFPAPPAGEYQFVCTYPGHSKQMQGVFIVK